MILKQLHAQLLIISREQQLFHRFTDHFDHLPEFTTPSRRFGCLHENVPHPTLNYHHDADVNVSSQPATLFHIESDIITNTTFLSACDFVPALHLIHCKLINSTEHLWPFPLPLYACLHERTSLAL